MARGDYHAAEISMTVANAFRGKRGRRLKLTDFLLNWGARKGAKDADGGDSDIDA